MGRSLNKKYFGNRNIGAVDTSDDGIGGNGIASVTIAGVWSGFTQATSTVTFGAPTLPGGVTATGTVTITAGAPVSVTMTNKGSGYVALPAVTIADSDVGAETSGTATAVFEVDSGNVGSTTNNENAIQILAWVPGGASSVIGDIVAQKGSRRLKVKTAQGTGVITLVAAVVAEGQGTIVASDTNGSTYWVTKLTSKKALLTQKVMSTAYLFDSDTAVPWTFDAASSGVVSISNA